MIGMNQTTALSIAAMAICCIALLMNSRRLMRQHRASMLGPELRTRSRVEREGGSPELHEMFYEPYLAEPAFVMRRRWRDENAAIEAEGRLFRVPGPKNGPVHWDHLDGWLSHADGLAVRVRFLRIENRDPSAKGLMSNDAVTIEFASQAEFAEYLSRLPATPAPRVIDREPVSIEGLLAKINARSDPLGTHG